LGPSGVVPFRPPNGEFCAGCEDSVAVKETFAENGRSVGFPI